YPTVPIVFCETRRLAEEWTYRFLGAALAAELDTADTDERISPGDASVSNAEIRAWARQRGLNVSARGRIAKTVVDAFWAANPGQRSSGAGLG
ncbi:MAG TPA: histone-like nucleoid-structuring protein Lsr2, partial [Jiangellaceae bacterium]